MPLPVRNEEGFLPAGKSDCKRRTYNPDHFAKLFEVEDRHFWFRTRNELIEQTLRRLNFQRSGPPRVLEVGCGTGNTLRVLEKVFGPHVIGLDLFAEGLQYARGRSGCALVCGDIFHPPFNSNFDVICLFDVLEHLADDLSILRGVNRLLATDGVLFLTVPAHPSLWSYFDELADHVRRYRPEELGTKLAQTGFQVEFQSGFMMSLFPLLWVGRRLNRWFGKPQGSDAERDALLERELHINPLLNRVLHMMISAENRLLRRQLRLPVGSSLLAIARKVRNS